MQSQTLDVFTYTLYSKIYIKFTYATGWTPRAAVDLKVNTIILTKMIAKLYSHKQIMIGDLWECCGHTLLFVWFPKCTQKNKNLTKVIQSEFKFLSTDGANMSTYVLFILNP